MSDNEAVNAKEILKECLRLRETMVQGVNDKYSGPLDSTTVKNTAFPLVLLLGNHSSGKSSFINHILGRNIQTSGVAPTDDCFTIIGPGEEDLDRNGPAVVNDPDLGFSALRHFGPILVHKTQQKIRKLSHDHKCSHLMMVDTPGMIDSPVKANMTSEERIMDRGYDFDGVCRWYAERADVILLFFDPDKPGTTGETLQILTKSLIGLDHKLHIILNKADQFSKIQDFARAYGSLCWNLSKVIPRKDLPQIHTMCLPIGKLREKYGDKSENGEEHFLSRGLASLEASRLVVEYEVYCAPQRRIDNEISRLADSVHVLRMHCQIIDDVLESYWAAVWRARLVTTTVSLTVVGLAGIVGLFAANKNSSDKEKSRAIKKSMAVVGGGGLLSVGIVHWWQNFSLENTAAKLSSLTSFSSVFRRLYATQIAQNDEFTFALWANVREKLSVTFGWGNEWKAMRPEEEVVGAVTNVSMSEDHTRVANLLANMPRVQTKDLDALKRITESDIVSLRRRASPGYFSLADKSPTSFFKRDSLGTDKTIKEAPGSVHTVKGGARLDYDYDENTEDGIDGDIDGGVSGMVDDDDCSMTETNESLDITSDSISVATELTETPKKQTKNTKFGNKVGTGKKYRDRGAVLLSPPSYYNSKKSVSKDESEDDDDESVNTHGSYPSY